MSLQDGFHEILFRTLTQSTKNRYRAPEILLKRPYSTGVDIWSVGCIAAELFQKSVLFPGTSSMNQIEIIFKKTNLNMHSHELKECCKSRIFLDMISKVKFDKFPKVIKLCFLSN